MGERGDGNVPYAADTQNACGTPSIDVGVVGVGHWATKFQNAIDGNALSYAAAVDVADYDDDRIQQVLAALDIDRNSYRQIEPGEPLPEDVFTDVDVVQIASPIQYHAEQTLQAADQADVVVTEKAYGPISQDGDITGPDDVQAAAAVYASMKEETGDTVTYPHLHYLQKQPTRWLDTHLDDIVEEYGPVQHVDATFIETYSDEDARRDWIFQPENGGIVMDWIHPLEVLAAACDATFNGVSDAQGYVTEPAYATEHPTAVRAAYDLDGDAFADDATATVRIGKGFDPGETRKTFRFHCDAAQLDVVYTGSTTERETDYRGKILVTEDTGDRSDTSVLETPQGGTPYELMAQDMLDAAETGDVPDVVTGLDEIYRAVDMTSEAVYAQDLVTDDAEITAFVQDAYQNTWP